MGFNSGFKGLIVACDDTVSCWIVTEFLSSWLCESSQSLLFYPEEGNLTAVMLNYTVA